VDYFIVNTGRGNFNSWTCDFGDEIKMNRSTFTVLIIAAVVINLALAIIFWARIVK